MDEHLSPLNPMKCIKTYSKAFTSHSKSQMKSENDSTHNPRGNKEEINEESYRIESTTNNEQISFKKGPLTAKNALEMLLEGTIKDKVCRYCLNVDDSLSDLDELMTIGNKNGVYSIAIKEMIASFYPVKVDTDPNFPSKICQKCIDRTLSSYLFSQQCDQTERALRDCFDDIFEKVDKLDPLERTKRRGRQKLKPNYNVINTEHKYVIDYAVPTMHIISAINQPNEAKIQDYECLKCSQILPDMISLLNHVKTHPKSTWFNCRFCGKSFPKLIHLKKHFRNDHNTKTDIKKQEENPAFTCNECGVTNGNYQEFLQHIEKHKFKTTLDHVLTGNMDKLCTICFDKESDMVSVDKVVNLHGGFEELTGDKTVKSMMAATLPEKKYKYQELYVAKQANVITLRKKDNSQKTSDFIFTSPFIISKVDMNRYTNLFDDYIFMFNAPQKSLKEHAYEPKAKKIKLDDKPKEKSEEKSLKSIYLFYFSNPIIDIDAISTHKDKTKIYIFDKDIAILKEKSQIIKICECNEPTTSCNICQTLKTADNCEIQNKDIEKQNNDSKKINPEEDIEQEIIGKENITIETNIVKEKIPTENIKDNNGRNLWQCTVCLTNNKAERDMCFCCENKTYSDVTKFNFKSTSSFNNVDNNEETPFHITNNNSNITENQVEQNITTDINTFVQITNENTNNSNEEKAINQKDMEMETEISNYNNLIINMDDTNFENKISAQEFNIIKPQFYEIPQIVEDMEIEDTIINEFENNNMISTNNFIIPTNLQSPPNQIQTWNTSLQFNVGTGSGDKGRKYKRPIRNVARAIHK